MKMKSLLSNKKLIAAGIFGLAIVVLASAVFIYWPAEKQVIEKPKGGTEPQTLTSKLPEPITAVTGKIAEANTVQKDKIAAAVTPKPLLPVSSPKTGEYQLSKTSEIQMSQAQGQQLTSTENGSKVSTQPKRLAPLFKPVFENKPVQTVTPEIARHEDRYQTIANYDRPGITQQQQKQLTKEMYSRVSPQYRKLFENIDQMKADSLQKSKSGPGTSASIIQEPNN
jgi:hypothetical protein